jgi:GNAT superfamily N-acetyltransferase
MFCARGRVCAASRGRLQHFRAASSWNVKGIEYRQVEKTYDPDRLFQFNKTYGSTPHNFIPEGPVRTHFGKIATGETVVWGAFADGEMVGLISSEDGGGYWLQTGHGETSTSFINEFVVNPNMRGKSIGKHLTKISVDAELGIFAIKPNVKEQYTTFHQDNIGSRTAFIKGGGYEEVVTYADGFRDRNTTVAKYTPPANITTKTPQDDLQPSVEGNTWTYKGITYRALERTYDPEALFQFNKTYGSTPHNFIPDGPVREHFGKIATGETTVWGAFNGDDLVGLISGENGGGYWLETGAGEKAVCFINEFVVNPEQRGKNIGKLLTKISVDSKLGIFGINPDIKEMYTTFHVDNLGSRTAFIKGGGYWEVMSYSDAFRERSTTVAKFVL